MLNDIKFKPQKAEPHLDGTVENGLKRCFTEQLVWENVRIRVILFPLFLPSVKRKKLAVKKWPELMKRALKKRSEMRACVHIRDRKLPCLGCF